jgi:hypothetical protein
MYRAALWVLFVVAVSGGDDYASVWDPADPSVAWLSKLRSPAVLAELKALASGGGLGFDGSHLDSSLVEAGGDIGWMSYPILNKGHFVAGHCNALPATCAVLAGLRAELSPIPGVSEEVGVRINRLMPGTLLRRHKGPGGRLVAHVGIQVSI